MPPLAPASLEPHWDLLQQRIQQYLALYRLFPDDESRAKVRDPLFVDFFHALNHLAFRIAKRHGSHQPELTSEEVVGGVFDRHRLTPLLEKLTSSQAPVRGYLYMVIKNEYVSWLRVNGDFNKQRDYDDEALDKAIASFVEPLQADEAVVRLRLAKAIDQLPPEHKRLVQLRFVDDLTLPECANATGVSLATVKRQLAQIYGDLAERL